MLEELLELNSDKYGTWATGSLSQNPCPWPRHAWALVRWLQRTELRTFEKQSRCPPEAGAPRKWFQLACHYVSHWLALLLKNPRLLRPLWVTLKPMAWLAIFCITNVNTDKKATLCTEVCHVLYANKTQLRNMGSRHVSSRLIWGTTSLRNCASLPQAYSVGKPVRVAACTGAAVPLRIGRHSSILEHQVTIRNKIMREGFILNLQKYINCTVLYICAHSS
jgi:hypothetical protein